MAQQHQSGHGATLTFTPAIGEDDENTNILASYSIISITPPTTTCEVVDFPHLGIEDDKVIPKAAAGGIDGGELSATISVDPHDNWAVAMGSLGVCELLYPANSSSENTRDSFDGIITSYTPGALESGERMTAELVITKAGDSTVTTS